MLIGDWGFSFILEDRPFRGRGRGRGGYRGRGRGYGYRRYRPRPQAAEGEEGDEPQHVEGGEDGGPPRQGRGGYRRRGYRRGYRGRGRGRGRGAGPQSEGHEQVGDDSHDHSGQDTSEATV